MTEQLRSSQQESRKLRADGARNREALLCAGKEMFSKRGVDASLQETARRAGVGIGTLYRHFPNRDSLIEAVYRREVDHLAGSAAELTRALDPMLALHEWLHRFMAYLALKKLLASALCSTLPNVTSLATASNTTITQALTTLVKNAVGAGVIRPDIVPADLCITLAGFTYLGFGSDWRRRARKLVDVLVAGLQTSPAGRGRRSGDSARTPSSSIPHRSASGN